MSNWIRIGAVADFPVGEPRELVVEGTIVALFNVNGELFALDGICPHQGGPLGKGHLSDCIVTCPWHGFQFNVRNGQHQSSAQLRQPCFPVKVEAESVYIDLQP